MRKIGVIVLHRLSQGIDDLIFELVGQIAVGLALWLATPLVFNFLVLGQRVGDQG